MFLLCGLPPCHDILPSLCRSWRQERTDLQAEQLSLVLLSSLVDKCDVLHCSVQTGDEAAREAKQ